MARPVVMAACSSGGETTAPSTGAGERAAASTAARGAPASAAAGGGSITVTSLWGGSEQEAFQKVLDGFQTATGITATYQAQRTDYATVLQSKITGGNPPDVAIMPG